MNPHEQDHYGVDTDRLLPGEDAHSADQRDAARWARVYETLVTAAYDMKPDARARPMFEARVDRYRRRLRFWRRRVEELSRANMADGD